MSFWSRSVDFIDFRVDKLGDKSCLGRQIILSLYRKAFRETFHFCLCNLKLSRSLIESDITKVCLGKRRKAIASTVTPDIPYPKVRVEWIDCVSDSGWATEKSLIE